MTSTPTPSVPPASGDIAPVTRQLDLRCNVEQAFDVFTTRIGLWWPTATHSVSTSPDATVRLEPGVDGRILELAPDGREHLWGRVRVWEPPRRLAFTWHPGQTDPELETRVEISFEALAPQTSRVTVIHAGWEVLGAAAAATRERYDAGWSSVLERFGRTAASAPTGAPRG